jgi:plasmid stabilization system protein ParE
MSVIRLKVSDAAFVDIDRLEDFLAAAGDPLAGELFDLINQSMQVLKWQPALGRRSGVNTRFGPARELVISRGRGGYIARYVWSTELHTVFVLRVRHQRESGFTSEEL